MIEDATVEKDRVAAKISADLTTINKLKEDLEKKTKLTTKTKESITESLETLRRIASDVDTRLSGKATFQLSDDQTNMFLRKH